MTDTIIFRSTIFLFFFIFFNKSYYLVEGLKCFPERYFITGGCTVLAHSEIFYFSKMEAEDWTPDGLKLKISREKWQKDFLLPCEQIKKRGNVES